MSESSSELHVPKTCALCGSVLALVENTVWVKLMTGKGMERFEVCEKHMDEAIPNKGTKDGR